MKRRTQIDDEPVHQERWLISYADFMTLLFALFVVLFASSTRDKQALQKLSSSVRDGFKDLQAFHPEADNGESKLPMAAVPQAQGEAVDLLALRRKLNQALGQEIAHDEIALRVTPEGFVISLHELGFFDSGQADLLPGAADKIKRLAAVLTEYGLNMRVEGHSDDVPIHNAQFASNWELSTARATTVARMLLQDAHVDPGKLSIAGYGQYHPAANNDTPEGRSANRRVDIVVVSASQPRRN